MVKKLEYPDGIKICTKCKEGKSLEEFDKRTYPSGVIQPISCCKKCKRKASVEWARNNPHKASDISKRSYRNNISKRLTDSERSKRNVWSKKYYKKYPEVSRKATAAKRALKLKATPLWINTSYIKCFYDLVKLEEDLTDIKYHVDHIVPLKSKYVCGLHSEDNLQILEAKLNIAKSNKTWPDMWTIDNDLIELANTFYA